MYRGLKSTGVNTWRLWAGVAIVFICGLLVGVAGTHAYHSYKMQQRWVQGLAGMKPRLMTHLTQELHLSGDQGRTVEALVSRAEADLLRLRVSQQPLVDETVARTTEAIKGVLTSEQQAKLEELYQTLQKRWASDRAYTERLQHSPSSESAQ